MGRGATWALLAIALALCALTYPQARHGYGAVPGLLVGALTVASSVFLFLYLLCVVSYLRIERGRGKRLAYGVFLVVPLALLASVGAKVLYPVAVFLVALLTSVLRERRHRLVDRTGPGARTPA